MNRKEQLKHALLHLDLRIYSWTIGSALIGILISILLDAPMILESFLFGVCVTFGLTMAGTVHTFEDGIYSLLRASVGIHILKLFLFVLGIWGGALLAFISIMAWRAYKLRHILKPQAHMTWENIKRKWNDKR